MILCRLVMVVIIFSVCWLPYHLYFLASMSHPTINKYSIELETKVHPKVRNHGEGPY